MGGKISKIWLVYSCFTNITNSVRNHWYLCPMPNAAKKRPLKGWNQWGNPSVQTKHALCVTQSPIACIKNSLENLQESPHSTLKSMFSYEFFLQTTQFFTEIKPSQVSHHKDSFVSTTKEKGINDYQQNHEVSPSIFQQNEVIQRKHRAQVFFLCGKQHCVRRIEATLLNCSDIKWRTKLMFALGKAGGFCSAFTIYQTILNRYVESYL